MLTSGIHIELRHGDLSEEAVVAARGTRLVAVDTETTGLDWRTADLAVIQVYVPGSAVEIVRVSYETPVRLLRLLQDETIVKVFHHAMFDLRFIASRWPMSPAAVCCTKIAAKILYRDTESTSLAPLVQRHLGRQLDKTEQVSDWSKELTASQIYYAATDVLVLPELLQRLDDTLSDENLIALAAGCWSHIPIRLQLDLEGYPDVFTY